MKKLIAILLAALMLVAMVACDDGKEPAKPDDTTAKTETTTAAPEDTADTTAEETTAAQTDPTPAVLKKEDLYGTWSLKMDMTGYFLQGVGDNLEEVTAIYGEDFLKTLPTDIETLFSFDEEGTISCVNQKDVERFFTAVLTGMETGLKNGGALKALAASLNGTVEDAQAYLDQNQVSLDAFIEVMMQQMPTVDQLLETIGGEVKDGYIYSDSEKTPYEVTEDTLINGDAKMTYAVENGKIIIKQFGTDEMMADINQEFVRVK